MQRVAYDRLHWVVPVCAVATVAIALTVVAGWVFKLDSVIQPIAGSGMMQLNTALCLALLGSAALVSHFRRPRLAIALASPPMAVGIVTLLEYLLNVNVGLDQMFMNAYLTHPTNPPGRMAVNTATSMAMAGTVVILSCREGGMSILAAQILSVALLVPAMFALGGHALALPPLHGWYSLTHMAPHTAIGLILLACAYYVISRRADGHSVDPTSRMPWLAVAVGCMTTLCVWQTLLASLARRGEDPGSFEDTALTGVVLSLGLMATLALAWSLYTRGVALRIAREHTRTNDALLTETASRRKAQEELEEREISIRTLLQSTAEGIIGLDMSGRCTFCNRAALRMLGLANESELLGADAHELFHHSHANGACYEEEHCPIRHVIHSGKEVHIDTEVFWRSDGVNFNVEYHVLPLFRGDTPHGAVMTFMDVTQRKRVDAALRKSEERIDLATRGASHGLWDWDLVEESVWYSDQFRQMLGHMDEEGFLGKIESMLDAVHPDDIAQLEAKLREHMEGYSEFSAECRMLGKLKEYRWFTVQGKCMRDAGGKVVRMAGTLQDTTERRQLLERLAEANQRLVAHARELELRTQEVEDFVYTVSHDFRAPLVNIDGFCKELGYSCDDLITIVGDMELPEATQTRLGEVVQTDIPGALHYISSGTANLSRLIESLLRLSRIGRESFQRIDLDMTALATDSAELLKKNLEAAGAEVFIGALPPAMGDETAVGQIFRNLLDNAISYFRPDVPGRISIGGERDPEDESMNRYWVRDNGIGIPEASAERVFKVFHRLRPDQTEGEGMGLTIIRRIVEKHGGKTWIKDAPGQGAVVYFTLEAGDRHDGRLENGGSCVEEQ